MCASNNLWILMELGPAWMLISVLDSLGLDSYLISFLRSEKYFKD